MNSLIGRKAKTHKGRKFLKKFRAKIKEGPRNVLFLKGTKNSEKNRKV